MNLWSTFSRKKKDAEAEDGQSYKKLSSLWDLLALGIGPSFGLGLYVLTGNVALADAGPGVIYSFVIAGIAAALSGELT